MGEGQKVNGAGREESGHIGRDRDGLRSRGAAGGDPGRERAVRHADAWLEIARGGIPQRAHERSLAAVQAREAVETHVGRARLSRLHPVADPLQGAADLSEEALGCRGVRCQHGRVGAPGQGR